MHSYDSKFKIKKYCSLQKKKKKKSSKRDLLKYFYEFVFKMLKKLMSYTYRNKMNIKRKKKCDINTLLFYK